MCYWRGAVLLNCTRLHCSDLHWIGGLSHTLHPTALFCTAFCALDCTAPTCNELHDAVIHCTPIHRSGLHFNGLYWTGLDCTQRTATHCTALHYTELHCTAMHCSALHCIALFCTALPCTALHCTALHLQCTSLHWTVLCCAALHCTRKCPKGRFYSIGASTRTRQESQCLPYAGFLNWGPTN